MGKKVAIMQPYFFPYIGYFHLIKSVDEFVIYDNIQYTKKGWINRNRILSNGEDKILTIPIKKDSDYLNIQDRIIADSWSKDKNKLLNTINNSYKKSPQFNNIFPIVHECLSSLEVNLFKFILNSLTILNSYLEIKTKIITSSDISIDHSLKSQDKVMAICKNLKATTYVNAIGGQELYNVEDFSNKDIKLKFVKSNPLVYKQYKNEFIPWLSILDVLFFNDKKDIIKYLNNEYSLI
tara:strand:+ start:1315 stop:2025 length:711 start_codon:yes stop_codon:yes gene_type:complete